MYMWRSTIETSQIYMLNVSRHLPTSLVARDGYPLNLLFHCTSHIFTEIHDAKQNSNQNLNHILNHVADAWPMEMLENRPFARTLDSVTETSFQ